MSSRDYPQRVFALQSADESKVYSFGVGTYVGDKRPPWVDEKPSDELAQMIRTILEEEDATPIDQHWMMEMIDHFVETGEITPEEAETRRTQLRADMEAARAKPIEERIQTLYEVTYASNPCIELDSGDTVWGAQCWWGPEERMAEKVGDREVITVPVPDENERWK